MRNKKYTTPPVFLSYRTAGGEPYARHLRDELEKYFGKGSVFQDYESIKTGSEWAQVIPQAVQNARLLLVLIHGDEWFTAEKKVGFDRKRRITLDDDWVRREIRIGLEAELELFPVVLSGRVDRQFFSEEAQENGIVPDDILPCMRKQLFQLTWGTNQQLNSEIERLAQKIEDADIGLSRQTSATEKSSREQKAFNPLAELPLPASLYEGLCHLDSPFVGTNFFKRETAPLFFGRENEISELYYKYL